MRYPNCNHESSATQKFCANCGTRLPQASNVNQGVETPIMSNGQLLGVLSLVTGIISLFVFSIVFGPAAIILGCWHSINEIIWDGPESFWVGWWF